MKSREYLFLRNAKVGINLSSKFVDNKLELFFIFSELEAFLPNVNPITVSVKS